MTSIDDLMGQVRDRRGDWMIALEVLGAAARGVGLDEIVVRGREPGLLVTATNELVCERCDAVLCDVEEDDTMDVLVAVAADHIAGCVGFG